MPTLSKIKVLIVDDSIMFRKALEMGLAEDLNVEVVGTAADPIEAMEKIQRLRPNVVTLDVEMPKMNGIDFLKQLMVKDPLPVVVVTSTPLNALDALQAGAVDFVRKPVANSFGLHDFIGELTVKIKVASTAHVSRRPAPAMAGAASASAPRPAPSPLTAGPNLGGSRAVIAIGASTGGTEAILSVVKNLPPTTPGIIIVQHMPPVFTNMYAQRVDRICRMRAKEAQDMDRVERGQIIIAAGEYHLRLMKDARGYYIRSEQGPRVSGHCPSVDVMFDSVAATAGRDAVGVILTGMGSDGAKGITKIRQAGGYTIGQDKDSCVVYGMPMEAYKLGGICKQAPVDAIGDEILRYLGAKR